MSQSGATSCASWWGPGYSGGSGKWSTVHWDRRGTLRATRGGHETGTRSRTTGWRLRLTSSQKQEVAGLRYVLKVWGMRPTRHTVGEHDAQGRVCREERRSGCQCHNRHLSMLVFVVFEEPGSGRHRCRAGVTTPRSCDESHDLVHLKLTDVYLIRPVLRAKPDANDAFTASPG
jgi:hypothetical protein